MENASKALLMAAEVLISIVVISALLLMFNSLTSYQKVAEENEEEATVIAFNNVYESYNRDDVRGNDLYSLINRVVDYNRRKSSEGTGNNDEGQYLAYEPITLIVNFNTINEIKEKLTYDGTLRVLENKTKYTISSTQNDFKKLFNNNGITVIETSYPAGALINLTTAITGIFIEPSEFNKLNENEQRQIIYKFNSAYGSQVLDVNNIPASWEKINSQHRENIYKYYEYLQFTRAHFKCISVGRNTGTGRIVKMEFEFTGTIN